MLIIFLTEEALSKFQSGVCKSPFQNRSQLIVSVFVVITAVALVFVIVRFFSGIFWGNKLGLEDWVIAGALVSVDGIYLAHYLTGVGTCHSCYRPYFQKFVAPLQPCACADYFSG